MSTIQVRRVQMRCRVRSGDALEQRRAQKIFRDDLALALEDAVAAAGIGDEEQICIRTLHLSARLWMGMTDDALRREFAEALAAQIRHAIARADASEVVRYVSEVAAVLDALRSVTRADVSRQWAWRQLGLATIIAPGGRRADVIGELLLSRPHAIVPALRALADEPSFWRLLASLEDAQFETIADAALAEAHLPLRVAGIAAQDAIPAVRSPRVTSVARRARAARLLEAIASPSRSIAVAVLAALETEPSLLRGNTDHVRVTIAELIDAMRTSRGLASRRQGPEIDRQPPSGNDQAPIVADPQRFAAHHPAHESQLARDESPRHTAGQETAEHAVHPLEDNDRHVNVNCIDGDDRDIVFAEGDGGTAPADGDAATLGAHSLEDMTATSAPREERERIHSDWAGLLFLINVLRDSAAIDPLLDDPALADRPASWVLHRLALLLVPAEPSDAAALVFAGMPLGTTLDTFFESAPTEEEQGALLRHARACIQQTCERLGADADESVLYKVCARRGEIVADPGWVTVRLPIDTVDLDLRRAGLDLNPDYVSWLGIVVRFAYD